MVIKRLDDDFSVCKVSDASRIDLADRFCFVGKTDEELSLVCRTCKAPADALRRDDGWKAFRIEGELDFSLIGILARIATLLAERKIGIFAVSTYNTDYVLTKAERYEDALDCLREAGCEIVG